MLIKAISLILGYWIERMNVAPTTDLAKAIDLRRILSVSAGVVTGVLIFFGGLFTILVDMILATHRADALSFSSASGIGVSLIVISILLEWALLNKSNWQLPVARETHSQQNSFQPLAEALAELIRSYTQERKVETGVPTPGQMPTTSATAMPIYN